MKPEPSRILFIRLSAVGDVINTIPALEAVRAGLPDAFIGFVVEDRAYDLIAGHPSVDRVHLFPRRRWERMAHCPLQWGHVLGEFSRFARDLRRERYDVALDFQGNLKGAMHGLLSGIRRRVGFSRGYCREASHFFTNLHVTPPGGPSANRVEKYLSLAAALGVPVNGASYRLPSSPASTARVSEFLAREGLAGYAAIHPGTSAFGKAKRWPPPRFSELARRIGEERGLKSVITWGPGERAISEEISRGSGGHAIPAPETRSILDLAELIRRARIFVGCDSGPLHLSSAVGTPSVALFGPKDPRVYGPYNPRRRIVYKPAEGDPMGAITVEDAFRAVADLLATLP